MPKSPTNHQFHEAIESAVSEVGSRLSALKREAVDAMTPDASQKLRLKAAAQFAILATIEEMLDDVPSDLRPLPADIVAVLNGER